MTVRHTHSPLNVRPHTQRTAHDDTEYIELQHPHIIIFDVTGRYRPDYKEFPPDSQGRSTLPRINFDAPPGVCPFFSASVVAERARYQEGQRYVR